MFRLDKCDKQLTAKLLISADEQTKSLVAFLPMIRMIAGDETLSHFSSQEDIITLLLMADPFSVQFSTKDIINAIYRQTIGTSTHIDFIILHTISCMSDLLIFLRMERPTGRR